MLVLTSKNYYDLSCKLLINNKVDVVTGSVLKNSDPDVIWEGNANKQDTANNVKMDVLLNTYRSTGVPQAGYQNTAQTSELPNINGGGNTLGFTSSLINRSEKGAAAYLITIIEGSIEVTVQNPIIGTINVSGTRNTTRKSRDIDSEDDFNTLYNYLKGMSISQASMKDCKLLESASVSMYDLPIDRSYIVHPIDYQNYVGWSYTNIWTGKKEYRDFIWSETSKTGTKRLNNGFIITKNDAIDSFDILPSDMCHCTVVKNTDRKFTIYFRTIASISSASCVYDSVSVLIGGYYYRHGSISVADTTALSFVVSGVLSNVEEVEFNYSLVNGELIANASGDYPEALSSNELITYDSKMNNKSWQEEMSRTLLTKYINGKFKAIAEVPIAWLIKNDVHINTQMQLESLQGTLINRKGVPCTFEVKRIEKSFASNLYSCTIELLEV